MKSECCEAPVKIVCDHTKGTAVPMYYVCVSCNHPCDIIEEIDYAERTCQDGQGEEITDQGE